MVIPAMRRGRDVGAEIGTHAGGPVRSRKKVYGVGVRMTFVSRPRVLGLAVSCVVSPVLLRDELNFVSDSSGRS